MFQLAIRTLRLYFRTTRPSAARSPGRLFSLSCRGVRAGFLIEGGVPVQLWGSPRLDGLGQSRPPAAERPWPPRPKEVPLDARHYEVMVILAPDLEERTVEPTLDTFLNVIRHNDGNVDNIEVWGRRRLAYEIDKYSEGIYSVLDVSCTPESVKELDRQLNLNEAVLRTKVIRPEIK